MGKAAFVALTAMLGAIAPGAGHALSADAGDCVALLARIRSTLQIAKLRPADAARVEALRDRGESLLAVGNLTGCLAPLREAAAILGI